MIEKHGDLNEDSVGDDFSNKKVTHVEKDGYRVANKQTLEDAHVEKTAFEQIYGS